MPNVFLVTAIVLLVSGLILRIMSRRHLTELGQSVSWYSPKAWFALPSRNMDYFTDRGMRLHLTSLALILLGVVMYLVGSRG